MFKKKNLKTYYYSDNDLRVQEIKSFRLKIAGLVVGCVVICLSLFVAVGHFSGHLLGLSTGQTNEVTHENQVLRDQVAVLASRVTELQTTLQKLDQQGNHLRLMVDLEKVDEETKAAGTGGALQEPVLGLGLDTTSHLLRTTFTALQKLSSEIKVQQQSYEQIIDKYEYNKGYFAAMPALKPMDGEYSTRGFGLRMHPVLGIFKTHQGLDIVNDVGTPVYAAADGVIEMASHSGGGYGIVVVIRHGYGYQTLYAHLSKVLVHEGQRIKRGDLIAKSGRTGLVTGPHLHYEVRYKGVCQNPIDYFLDDVTAEIYHKQIASR
ncbi:MAG: M23 family metallopeptidase [Ignavibacteria bacterium]|nr:M23 family metallopeptidase [Ignavibacteria bacterium]